LLADAVSLHLRSQIEAGVQAVQLFDTWGGILSTPDFEIFSLHYLQYIVNQLKGTVPIILFTKGGSRWLSQIAQTGCDVVAVDWEISLKVAAEMVGSQVALQGNMHPATLLQSPELIHQEAVRILENYGKSTGHIFNLGHGITPDVPPEHVAALVDAVHTVSAKRVKEEGAA
jgi:uroporphyrinogen decarboxylase